MKPIAVVHHLLNGRTRISNCYTQRELNDMTEHMKAGKSVFVTYLCSPDAIIPPTKSSSVLKAI